MNDSACVGKVKPMIDNTRMMHGEYNVKNKFEVYQ
jgi:hypothetical protein